MGLSQHGYLVLSYSLCVAVLVGVAAFALVASFMLRRRTQTAEDFITARSQFATWRIAWSMWASSVGAWVIAAPASFSPFAGIIGMLMYAFSMGGSILLTAAVGNAIAGKLPGVLSMTDFVGWRFGTVAQWYFLAMALFNMAIVSLSEMTTAGSLFQDYIGSEAWIIILLLGVLSLSYTAVGGLVVSIITDQLQGIASTLLFSVCIVYVAATFRYPLPHPPPCDEGPYCISGTNETGFGSIFAMPVSLACGLVFSEASFQRVWASQSPRVVWTAAAIASAAVTVAVTFAGLCGLLAAWAGLIPDWVSPNLYFFYALKGSINDQGMVANWIGVLCVVLMVTMCESTVDSIQNGIGAALSSHLLKSRPLIWTQAVVVAANVPLIVLGTRGFSVLKMFLLANMLNSTALLPLLAGLPNRLQRHLGGGAMVASSLLSFAATSAWGSWFYCAHIAPAGEACSTADGMRYTWLDNGYDYRYFLATLLSAAGGMLLIGGASWALQRLGYRLPVLPGFAAPATSPERFLRSRKWSQAVLQMSRRQLGSLNSDIQLGSKGQSAATR